MKLSVVIPVYNERTTIEKVIRLIQSVPVDKEIIVVDDGSTDGTREILAQMRSEPNIQTIFHSQNGGKGKAVRTGLEAAASEAVIIQDADMEYDPMDYIPLLQVLQQSGADVVYGSRFLSGKKVTSGWHRFVNFFLTMLTNILYGSKLTDMETCYKLFRKSVLPKLNLVCNGFEIEVEITAKLLKNKFRIVEAPVSYKGRTYHEGKKIGWKDGLKAVWYLFKHRFIAA